MGRYSTLKVCAICGKKFLAAWHKYNAKCCSTECSYAWRKKVNKEYREKIDPEKKKEYRKLAKEKYEASKKKGSSLDDDIRSAREAGISYGQYMARKMMGK